MGTGEAVLCCDLFVNWLRADGFEADLNLIEGGIALWTVWWLVAGLWMSGRWGELYWRREGEIWWKRKKFGKGVIDYVYLLHGNNNKETTSNE